MTYASREELRVVLQRLPDVLNELRRRKRLCEDGPGEVPERLAGREPAHEQEPGVRPDGENQPRERAAVDGLHPEVAHHDVGRSG